MSQWARSSTWAVFSLSQTRLTSASCATRSKIPVSHCFPRRKHPTDPPPPLLLLDIDRCNNFYFSRCNWRALLDLCGGLLWTHNSVGAVQGWRPLNHLSRIISRITTHPDPSVICHPSGVNALTAESGKPRRLQGPTVDVTSWLSHVFSTCQCLWCACCTPQLRLTSVCKRPQRKSCEKTEYGPVIILHWRHLASQQFLSFHLLRTFDFFVF